MWGPASAREEVSMASAGEIQATDDAILVDAGLVWLDVIRLLTLGRGRAHRRRRGAGAGIDAAHGVERDPAPRQARQAPRRRATGRRKRIPARPVFLNLIVNLTGGAFTPRGRAFVAAVPNLTLDKPFNVAELRAIVNERVR